MNKADKEILRGACRSGLRVALAYDDLETAMRETSQKFWFVWAYAAAMREDRRDITEEPDLKARFEAIVRSEPNALLEVMLGAVPPEKALP